MRHLALRLRPPPRASGQQRLDREGGRGLPSVWGRRIAFVRGRSILLGDLQRRTTRELVHRLPDEAFDVELGASHLAYVSLFSNGSGVEGDIELRLRALAGGAEQILDDQEVGETSWTDIGALTFLGSRLIWQDRLHDDCQAAAATFAAYDLHTGTKGLLAAADVPVGVSRAADSGPDLAGCE
jgi:hypothetical protein